MDGTVLSTKSLLNGTSILDVIKPSRLSCPTNEAAASVTSLTHLFVLCVCMDNVGTLKSLLRRSLSFSFVILHTETCIA